MKYAIYDKLHKMIVKYFDTELEAHKWLTEITDLEIRKQLTIIML